MKMVRVLLVLAGVLALAGCGGGGDDGSGGAGERAMPPSTGDRDTDAEGAMTGRPEPRPGGRAIHGIGTWLEYATTDGAPLVTMTFERHVYHTQPESDEGRWMLLVALDAPEDAPDLQEGDPCLDQRYHFWDLETGNWAACVDVHRMPIAEKTPHDGRIPLFMQRGDMWTVESCWYDHSHAPLPECHGGGEEYLTVERCGIRLNVPAGTFDTCRIVLEGASYSPWAHDIIWYAPAENLLVKRDTGGGAGVVYELSNYNLAGVGGPDTRVNQPDDDPPGGGIQPETTAICAHEGRLHTPDLPLGSLLFNNNPFGAGDVAFDQCLLTRTVDGDVQRGWRWDWPVDGQGIFRGLPSAIYGRKFWMTERTPGSELPLRVSQILRLEALDASFDVELTAQPGSRYVLHFDLLFTAVGNFPPGQDSVVTQVVIHLDNELDLPWSPTEPSAVFGGRTYEIVHNPDGFFGPATVLQGRDPQYAGVFDLKAVLQEMVRRDFILPSHFLASIELSTLVLEGQGQLWVREYEVDVVD